jgi:hypothetical protein
LLAKVPPGFLAQLNCGGFMPPPETARKADRKLGEKKAYRMGFRQELQYAKQWVMICSNLRMDYVLTRFLKCIFDDQRSLLLI